MKNIINIFALYKQIFKVNLFNNKPINPKMTTNLQNSSYLSKSKLNMSGDGTNNDRMQKLAEKLGRITTVIENEKSTKFEQYEQKTVNIYNSIEETKENNNTKFNDVKEQILVIQKTLEDDSAKREAAHNEFMDFMKKMEEKIFEKFDMELQAKKEIEVKVAQYLEEKFNVIKNELQNQSKSRYDSIENLENYFEKELPKIQTGFKMEQTEREENDNAAMVRLNDEIQKIDSAIQSEKKNREETQEGILEMIKIMNDRMNNDLANERKEREQNEEVLIDVLENTCNRLQQTTAKI